MITLGNAIAIAAKAHAGQVDKAGAPYVLHVLRVMLRLNTNDERIVGVLHDLIEDTNWTMDDLRREKFPEVILDAIDSVTKREGEDYKVFVGRAGRNAIGRKVKLADLEDNLDMSRIPQPTKKDHARIEKYRDAVVQIQDSEPVN